MPKNLEKSQENILEHRLDTVPVFTHEVRSVDLDDEVLWACECVAPAVFCAAFVHVSVCMVCSKTLGYAHKSANFRRKLAQCHTIQKKK